MTLKYDSNQKGCLCFLAESWRGTQAPEGGGPGRPLPLRRSHFQMCSLLASSSSLSAFGQERKTSLPRGREIPIPHALRSVVLFYTPKVFLVIFVKCQTSNYYFSIDSPRTALCTPSSGKTESQGPERRISGRRNETKDTILCLSLLWAENNLY